MSAPKFWTGLLIGLNVVAFTAGVLTVGPWITFALICLAALAAGVFTR